MFAGPVRLPTGRVLLQHGRHVRVSQHTAHGRVQTLQQAGVLFAGQRMVFGQRGKHPRIAIPGQLVNDRCGQRVVCGQGLAYRGNGVVGQAHLGAQRQRLGSGGQGAYGRMGAVRALFGLGTILVIPVHDPMVCVPPMGFGRIEGIVRARPCVGCGRL